MLAKRDAQSPKEFKVELARFGDALKDFLPTVPLPDSSIAFALKTAWMNGHHEDLICTICETGVDPEDYWDSRFGPAATDNGAVPVFARIKADLTSLQELVEQIRREERGQGRDADRPAHFLIDGLAKVFKHFTRQDPTRANDHEKGASSHFALFVKAINDLIPAELRIKRDLDNLVRAYIERQAVQSAG